MDQIGLVTITVILQKVPIAISFGVLFLSAGRLCSSLLTLGYGILFVAATPLGIGIMWADFGENIRETDPTILCIHGAVCGTLIYYACCDLIAREF